MCKTQWLSGMSTSPGTEGPGFKARGGMSCTQKGEGSTEHLKRKGGGTKYQERVERCGETSEQVDQEPR